MDNRQIDVRGDCDTGLRLAVELAMLGAPGQRVTHFADDPAHGLVLLWSAEANASPLPVPLNAAECLGLVRAWLSAQPPERMIDEMDHDGHNKKGWRLYNEEWGHVAQYHYAVFAIQPCWAWYGK